MVPTFLQPTAKLVPYEETTRTMIPPNYSKIEQYSDISYSRNSKYHSFPLHFVKLAEKCCKDCEKDRRKDMRQVWNTLKLLFLRAERPNTVVLSADSSDGTILHDKYRPCYPELLSLFKYWIMSQGRNL